MFVHLGGDIIIRTKEIIAILDYSKKENERMVASLIDYYEHKGKLLWISKEATKSIVITEQQMYGSPISSLTLIRRA